MNHLTSNADAPADRRSIYTLEGVVTLAALLLGTILIALGALAGRDVLVTVGGTLVAVAVPGFAIGVGLRKGLSAGAVWLMAAPLALLLSGCPATMDPSYVRRDVIAGPAVRVTERHDAMIRAGVDHGEVTELEAGIWLDESALLRHLAAGDPAQPVQPGTPAPPSR